MINNNIPKNSFQALPVDSDNIILSDKKPNGEERPWRFKKVKSLELSESYERLDMVNKQLKVLSCGDVLAFKVSGDGKKKLSNVYFCKSRLCSMCAWRRELKVFTQVSKVITHLNAESKYRFLFLTLTCKNVTGEDLQEQINLMFMSYKRLFLRKDVDKAVKGWFRALEVTHDVNKKITKKMYSKSSEHYKKLGLTIGDNNPNYNMYHPHFHVVLMVNKSYFSNDYMKQSEWTSLWQESLRCDYTPIVNIKPFRAGSKKSVLEAAKYTVKDADYLVKDNFKLTDETVSVLDLALRSRRLVAFGKILKDVHKQLNLSNIENDDDLIHIDDDPEMCDEVIQITEVYKWNIGYSNYVKFLN